MVDEAADSELGTRGESAAAVVESVDAPPVLVLDGTVVVKERVERVEKEHDYRHYEALYGKKVRTIKWWVQQGRAAEGGADLPPLDKPVEMPVWWRRVMTQRCPDSVEAAARAASGPVVRPEAVPVGESGAAGAVAAPGPAAAPGARVPLYVPTGVTTQEENLQHLREQMARARAELLELQNAAEPEQGKIDAKERKWRELRAEVEKSEEVVFRLRAKQGKLVDVEVLAAELQPMLVTVAAAVRGLANKMKQRLAMMGTDEERDAVWNAGVDECFEGLIGAGFVTREQLALAS